MKVVVTGMMATYPVGGVAFDYGHYVGAFRELGHEVFYLEDTGGPTYDPRQETYGDDPSYGIDFVRTWLPLFDPEGDTIPWCFRTLDGTCHGATRSELDAFLRDADLFVNVSGSALLRPDYLSVRDKILIDSDPGYNHYVSYPRWDTGDGYPGMASFRDHDHFFTYAMNLGAADCVLPDLDLQWHTTRPVVVPRLWHNDVDPDRVWTTVMTWKNFADPIEGDGMTFGTKEMEFPLIEDLPRRASSRLCIASGGASPPFERWRGLGWECLDAHDMSRTPLDYRDFIQRSMGELSVAKNVYVATHSGWFSCRSICYLAAGRPVVVQDTGFTRHVPTGAGILAFADGDEALAALEAVEADYPTHAEAARQLAVSEFGPEAVLGPILTRCGFDVGATER